MFVILPTTIRPTAPNIPSVLQQLTNESKLLLEWIKNNQLKANPDKFHLILSEKTTQFQSMLPVRNRKPT